MRNTTLTAGFSALALVLAGCTTTKVDPGPPRAPDPCPSEITAELNPPPKDPSTEQDRVDWVGALFGVTDQDKVITQMEYYRVTLPNYADRLYSRMLGAKAWCANPKRR